MNRGITASAQFVIDSRSSTPNLKALRYVLDIKMLISSAVFEENKVVLS